MRPSVCVVPYPIAPRFNAQGARNPYHLSVQLLSPAPFLHGAPHAPRLHYRGAVRVGGGRNEVRKTLLPLHTNTAL